MLLGFFFIKTQIGLFEIADSLKLKHTFGVKIAKAEGNYHADLLEPLAIHEEDSEFFF